MLWYSAPTYINSALHEMESAICDGEILHAILTTSTASSSAITGYVTATTATTTRPHRQGGTPFFHPFQPPLPPPGQ
jgi:hypothetical protein